MACNKDTKYRIIRYSTIFFLSAIAILFGGGIVKALPNSACSPEDLLAEKNPVEKVYCYAEKFNFRANTPGPYPGGIDWEDAYMNDPMFEQLIPIAKQIIALEEKDDPDKTALSKIMLEQQIEQIFNNRENAVKQEEEQSAEEARKKRDSYIGYVVFGAGAIFIIYGFGKYLKDYMNPVNIERRRREREEKIRAGYERMESERRQQDSERQRRERERQQAEKVEWDRIEQLKNEIREMPRYKLWRQDVLKRHGEICSMKNDECSGHLEIHHNYKSLHRIIKENGITSTKQAISCRELWDVENGIPLCKYHHDRMDSSEYREKNKKN